MDSEPPLDTPALERKTFLWLLVAVSAAFAWILWPFYGAVFWGAALAILFAPVYRRLLARMNGRRTPAALATLALILLIVILPLTLLALAVMQEVSTLYEMLRSGEIDPAHYFERLLHSLPSWATHWLERLGIADLGALQRKLAANLSQGSQAVAKQALSIGQNTFDWLVSFAVTLYLAFFLVRDGAQLVRHIRDAVPLDAAYKRTLARKFTTVIRATVKGNVLVAAVQGALGGVAFWFLDVHAALLWAVLMAFLSLLPAVGAALVWLPVAVWFLVSGDVWQGVGLIAWGVLVIGLIDNVLRPVLVGKDTRMPDYVVLVSTIGGMAIFGINGFVIGPVIAAMFISAWDIFATERAADEAAADAAQSEAVTARTAQSP
jgi:predicted PurR-regulated permease PerM